MKNITINTIINTTVNDRDNIAIINIDERNDENSNATLWGKDFQKNSRTYPKGKSQIDSDFLNHLLASPFFLLFFYQIPINFNKK